jgi:hypothetical protein
MEGYIVFTEKDYEEISRECECPESLVYKLAHIIQGLYTMNSYAVNYYTTKPEQDILQRISQIVDPDKDLERQIDLSTIELKNFNITE